MYIYLRRGLWLLLFSTCACYAEDDTLQWHEITLRSGQIVLADGVGPTSVLLSLVGRKFSPFVHSGVVVIEGGRPYVYEAIGKYPLWGTRSPGHGTKGRIARTPLVAFMRNQAFMEFYDPPAHVDRQAVVDFVQKSFRDAVPFDARFLSSRDGFYCSELVAFALEAGGQPVTMTKFLDNASLAVLRRWMGATDDWIITTTSLIKGARYAGTITTLPSRANFYAYFAAKRELHRRFTTEQKLGNLFYLDGRELELRPAVWTFIDLAMSRFPEEEQSFSSEHIYDTVRKIADTYFVPMGFQQAQETSLRTSPIVP